MGHALGRALRIFNYVSAARVLRLVLGLAMVLGLAPAVASAQTTGCRFVLGFMALHDLVPEVVGDCVGDETHNPLNGDALQATTGGLLVWRAADNWTAFTDGSATWINGPLGLQQRPNAARLFWEANPDGLPIVPPPVAGERCHTAGLTLSLVDVDAGAGNLFGTFRLTSTLDVACTFFGYPGALLLDAAGSPQPTTVVRGGGPALLQGPPTSVTVAADGSALLRMHWEQVPVGDEPTCSMAASLAVIPPDEYVPLTLPIQIRACGGGHLDVGPVQLDQGL